MFAYPWGVKGTSLENETGPNPWQTRALKKVGELSANNALRRAEGLPQEVVRLARVSGHGVGKSALVAWLIQWIMSTRPDARGVVTASTNAQLETKTWPELAKWHAMLINKYWFKWSASAYTFALYPDDQQKNYMINAATVSEHNTEAFAGLHNATSCVLAIFDEASGVLDKVYEIIEGAFVRSEPFFFLFGNPTRADGPFYDACTKLRDMWDVEHVDNRTVPGTNPNVARDILRRNDGNEDCDEFRIRVRGEFPTKSYSGYIAPPTVVEAQKRQVYPDLGVPLILGVDVARFGDDTTVLCPRRGTDARSLAWLSWKNQDTMVTSERIAEWAQKYKPDTIVVESVGPGVGVIDILRSWKYKVIDFHPGALSAKPGHSNKRMDIWNAGSMWLRANGCIPSDLAQLYSDLVGIQYELLPTGKMKMEDKERMKARGLTSPDWADALMLTFAVQTPRLDTRSRNGSTNSDRNRMAVTDYDEYAL